MNNQTIEYERVKKSGGCCCASKDKSQTELLEPTAQNTNVPVHTLAVKGASCGGCVGKIERALLSVAGVEKAHMNLITGIATISGGAPREALISVLAGVGFSANKTE